MNCEICGAQTARVRRVTRSCGNGHSAFLIQNVPVVTCPSCAESYMTADTLKEIKRIRLPWRQLAKPTKVPLATFGGAA